MSLGYSLSVDLDSSYNQENIYAILLNGTNKLSLTYYKIDYAKLDCIGQELSLESALRELISGTPDKDLHCIIARCQKTHFFLHILDKNGKLLLMLSSIFNPWMKKNYEDEIDIERYDQLISQLVENFKVINKCIEPD